MSNALTPSIESTVASGLASVNACRTCATHSVPARVRRAYWNGAVKRSTASIICWATVRPTKRLMTSPATMPRTPPSGFWSAVILPMRIASTATSGASPRANCSPALKSQCRSAGLDSKNQKCSEVMPDGPGAPLRDDLKFWQTSSRPGQMEPQE